MCEFIWSEPAPGIPQELAAARAAAISMLRYELTLRLPAEPADAITGHIRIRFRLAAGSTWPPLDFAPASSDAACASAVADVIANGAAARFTARHGYILIESDRAALPEQTLEIRFSAGSAGLRRRPDLVYSLFVPAQAHRVFPCFDQPDLKAPLALELNLPGHWDAVANAPESARDTTDEQLLIRFDATDPLPPYLFAFAAGRLLRQQHACGQRTFEIACMPSAAEPLDRNLQDILDLHAAALDFLEHYTAIDYPFAKLGLLLIPDFEFSGMEHPGAVYYRQDQLLLPPGASDTDRQRRAALIAHETAHMWFGNLVTMRWFDDVWTKEVFANLIADKILAHIFPDSDHDTDFLLRHYPPVHAVDRTQGTQPICRPLARLADAGDNYDALIYHKAPIAMAALEAQIGSRALRDGLRDWLATHAGGNSAWPELRAHLQRHTRHDLAHFESAWLNAPGTQHLQQVYQRRQIPTFGCVIATPEDREDAQYVLEQSSDRHQRAALWIMLYEDMQANGIAPSQLLATLLQLLKSEDNDLLLSRLLADLHEIFWRCLSVTQRGAAAGAVERVLRLRLQSAQQRDRWLAAFARIATTPESVAELESIWHCRQPAIGQPDEQLATLLALTIGLHRPDQSNDILQEQIGRMRNADRCDRLAFVAPALAPDIAMRDALFERLLAGAGRGIWRPHAAELLNHPLRADAAVHYLIPGMHYADSLRQQGEIFLPRQWLTALFSGHTSPEAATTIQSHLDENALPAQLRLLILQTADPVFRCARWACR